MKNINKVIIEGRLTKKPELKQTNTGTSMIVQTIAVNNGTDESIFIDFIAWKGTAETIATYCDKGDSITISGYIDVKTWKDKDEKEHKSWRVNAQEFWFGKKAGKNEAEPKEQKFETVEGDLPF